MLGFLVFSVATAATFDWGTDCTSGSGRFSDPIPHDDLELVGTIPTDKDAVRIDLSADADVDVQIVDQATGTVIVGWPNGLLSGPSEACASYKGLEYCYSGYNGVGGDLGREWIELKGATNRELQMLAYGYQPGTAEIEYSFKALNTCNERGDGTFSQYLPHEQVSRIGEIPVGKANVLIELESDRDIDIQLIAADGTRLVHWPDGLLNGPTPAQLTWNGMTLDYSGYNGTAGRYGDETLRITGTVSMPLEMKAFAYQPGTADVTYAWGLGTGQICGSRGLVPCLGDLQCKDGDTGHIAVDRPGQCHTETWCESPQSAAKDCAVLGTTAGGWTCEEFTCVGNAGSGGAGSSCASSDDCAPGFVCMGEYAYDTPIECVGPEMYGTFNNPANYSIPDAAPGGVNSTVQVQGLASVPVDMVVTLDLDHPRTSDLVITLTDPNGDVASVWNRESNPQDRVVIDNGIPGDDSVNGPWTLNVADQQGGSVGTLRGWSFYVVSRWD